jgi:hypothetical protein
VGATLTHFLPRALSEAYDQIEEWVWTIVEMLSERPGYFPYRQHVTHIVAVSHIFSHLRYSFIRDNKIYQDLKIEMVKGSKVAGRVSDKLDAEIYIYGSIQQAGQVVQGRRGKQAPVAQIEAAITPRTKAIQPVDLYGQAAPIDEIMKMIGAMIRGDISVSMMTKPLSVRMAVKLHRLSVPTQ